MLRKAYLLNFRTDKQQNEDPSADNVWFGVHYGGESVQVFSGRFIYLCLPSRGVLLHSLAHPRAFETTEKQHTNRDTITSDSWGKVCCKPVAEEGGGLKMVV